MQSRWLSPITMLCLLALPAAAPAGDKTQPMIVVRVRSVDAVVDNVKLVVALAGRENVAQQIEGLIKAKIGPNGLEGIDSKRPFGGYARIGNDFNDVVGVAMIPIADEKAFLSLLENLNLKPTKDKNGLYTVKTPTPIDVSFRFANKYAYATAINLDALNPANLMDPATVFPAQQTATLSATVRLDKLPKDAKQFVLGKLEEELEKARDKKEPAETEKQREFRMQVLTEIGKRFKMLLDEGGEINAEADINRQTKELTASVSLTGVPTSTLATNIQGLGKTPSLFAGLAGSDSAARGLVHFIPQESVRKAFEAIVDEGSAKALANFQDAAKRGQAETLVKALMPTLKSGDVDAAFNFNRPAGGKNYNLVLGVKLKDGEALGKAVRDLAAEVLKDVPAAEAAKVKLDAETVGAVKVHRIDAQEKYDLKGKAMFGDNPIYIAFRKDAFFLVIGEDGLGAMKRALDGKSGAAAPPFELGASLARLAPLLAKTDEQREAASKLFAGADEGKVSVTVSGGAALRLRLTADLSVVEFFSKFGLGAQLGAGAQD